MRGNNNKRTQIIIQAALIAIVAICISGQSLLSLPFFYEQTAQNRTMIYLGVSIFIFLVLFLIANVFILPFISKFKIRTNLLFLIIFTVILTLSIGLGNANLWAIPEIHSVEICFTADDGVQDLMIEKIFDPNKNRLYPPDSFGFTRYPITLESDSCINGRITNLVSKMTESLMGNQLSIVVQESPPSGRFFVSINESPAVVTFDQKAEPLSTTSILFTEGLENGKRIESPYQKLWFNLLKLISIFINSVFLSLFLFGLTERIQSFTDNDSNPNIGGQNAEN